MNGTWAFAERSMHFRAMALAFVALVAPFLAGCGMSEPPQFRLNLEGRDPAQVTPAQQQVMTEALEKLFGTPDDPKLPKGVQLNLDLLKQAAGPVAGEATGRQRGLFRRYCAGCHGISGDGAGPMASLLNPYPRDFRNGVFKWKSTKAGAKPTQEDLTFILRRGIPGTAMPSFMRLPDEEIQSLIEYVKYLSIRGEAERFLLRQVVDEDEALSPDLQEVMDEGVLPAANSWTAVAKEPNAYVIQPPPEPPMITHQDRVASITLGQKLYASNSAQCVKCHGPEGRGDGTETELYDDWNKPKKGATPDETRKLASRFSLPPEKIRPRNFHEGIFRGGNSPEQLYDRIDAGIAGTPMPAAGPAGGTKGVLTPEEIWHVVHYIQSLSRKENP